MPDTFFSKCAPLQRVGIDSCAGLTTCNLSPTTVEDLEEIYKDTNGRYRIMGSLLDTDITAGVCQIEESPLYAFIRANAQDWGTSKLTKTQTVGSGLIDIQPFIKIRRKNLINNNYWKWTKTGESGTVSGITYDIVGTAESLTSIPSDINWFPAGLQIFISGVSDGGTATKTQWKVVHATVSAGKVNVYVRSQNAGSTLAASKLSTPVSGVIMRGMNNISPYEKHCDQIPRLNTEAQFLAFVQTSRWSLCNDQLTKKYKEMLLQNNPLYARYYHVEEGEYNKQIITDWQNRLVHSFLFGKAFANQNETDWPELEVIESMSDGLAGDHLYLEGLEGRCVGRRANAEGVYEQLNACGRVLDLQGDVFNFPEFQELLYTLYRTRKSSGTPQPDLIEIVVDSAFRVQFIQALIRYLKMRYEDTLRFNMDVSGDKKADLGFTYQDFKLDYPSVTLRVVSHVSFDDYVSAHKAVGGDQLATASRWILMLDWSNIYMANIMSETVDLTTGNIQDLAKINSDAFCRMKVPTKSIRHHALMWTTVVECPSTSLWIENFSFQVPEHGTKYGNPALTSGKGSYFDVAGDNPANNA